MGDHKGIGSHPSPIATEMSHALLLPRKEKEPL
jgi:hypothetical protein